MGKAKTKLKLVPTELKLDLGCGARKKEGFTGVDQHLMEGVDIICDLGVEKWPWEDNSVDEVNCSHFLEHLNSTQRVHFFNELYRVMKKDAKAIITTPHWGSSRAYGDPTHQWPPVSEMSYYYLSREWRAKEAPHTDIKWNRYGYDCHFECSWGYSVHPEFMPKSQQVQQFAVSFYREAVQDMQATVIKK